MTAYLVEWLSLLGRWVHFVVGVAWIGASFYFVWLDNHLRPVKNPDDEKKGVGGEIWSVHGGGCYHAQKYRVAPPTLPETLHWFKWEAYTTWISGMFLLALIYWYGAEVYLIDRSLLELSRVAAIAIGAGVIIGGWLIYDLMCKSPLAKNESLLSGAVGLLAVVTAIGLCQIFSGRGAYMHFGAMLGTIMVANVFFVIMPGQRALVAAAQHGERPDPAHGIRAKTRSVHNTYFTLPVLFVMISNHYAMTYNHSLNWLILIAFTLAGALIRVYFVARHNGTPSILTLVIAMVLLGGVAALIAPATATTAAGSGTPAVSFAQVQDIVQTRCVSCHAAVPTHVAFVSAPAGVLLDNAQQILAEADRIYQQTVVLRAMPIGNLTGITEAERAAIAHWYTASQRSVKP